MSDQKTILIIDDEPDFVKALSIKLSDKGYSVLESFDGFDGLNKARELKPSLVLLDIMLPKLNGFKIARFLKFDENFKNIPIILLTARAEEEDKVMGTTCGADNYVTKPFDDDELYEAIEELIKQAED